MTSYQKLKEKNRLLAEQLLKVCLSPETQEAREIVSRVRTESQIEAAIWSGDIGDMNGFKGLINHVSQCST